MSSVSIDVDPDTFLVFRDDFCSATSVKISVRNVSSDKPAIFKVRNNLFEICNNGGMISAPS